MRLAALYHIQRKAHRGVQRFILKDFFSVYPHRCAVVAADDKLHVAHELQFCFKSSRKIIERHTFFGRFTVQNHIEHRIFRFRKRLSLALSAIKIGRLDR